MTSDRLDLVWPAILPWIEVACRRGLGRYEPEDFCSAIRRRDMQLWIAARDDVIEAACITEIVRYPRKTFVRIVVGTGHRRHRWQHFAGFIERWARERGCDGAESVMRPGWKKIFGPTGWVMSHIFMEKEF